MGSIIEVLERSPPQPPWSECFRVRFEVVSVVLMMIQVFWDVTPF